MERKSVLALSVNRNYRSLQIRPLRYGLAAENLIQIFHGLVCLIIQRLRNYGLNLALLQIIQVTFRCVHTHNKDFTVRLAGLCCRIRPGYRRVPRSSERANQVRICLDNCQIDSGCLVYYRTFQLHYECGVLLYHMPVVEELLEDLDRVMAESALYTVEDWNRRGLFRKIFSSLFRLGAIWL